MASSEPLILLFGTPGAGKSALLGALAQAASAQPALLKGTLLDEKKVFGELQKNTYESKLEPTEGFNSYEIRVKPVDGPVLAATVVDCSGKTAREALFSSRPFGDASPMNKPLLAADTVLILVDASMSSKQLGEEFQQFGRWLLRYHEMRGRRTEIGNLPVYMVLTKCDMLAKPGDTPSAWMQRIEEAKRRVDEKFREYLQNQGTGFGSIQLRLWASSIKRPALVDRPAKAEPYGVAELFRQCLQSARDYSDRRQKSQGRLHSLLIATLGIVAVLGFAVSFLMEAEPATRHTSLDASLQSALPQKEENRLHASIKQLEKRRGLLTEIQNDPDFEHLPAASKKAVTRYREELIEYLQLYDQFQTRLKHPHLAKDEEEYNELKKTVYSFKLPESHVKDWEDTRLAKRLDSMRKEFNQVNGAMNAEEGWIRDQIKKNQVLLKEGNQIFSKLSSNEKLAPQEVERWNLAFRDRLQPRTRTPREENIPGTHMTYEDLDKFMEIKKAQKDWGDSKDQLKAMSLIIQGQLKTR